MAPLIFDETLLNWPTKNSLTPEENFLSYLVHLKETMFGDFFVLISRELRKRASKIFLRILVHQETPDGFVFAIAGRQGAQRTWDSEPTQGWQSHAQTARGHCHHQKPGP